MNFYPLTIKDTRKILANTTEITLSIPENLRTVFEWKSGQFVRLQIEIEGDVFEREYSMVNLPSDNFITFAVKETSNGFASKWLNANSKKGDVLHISAPMGNFTFPYKPNEKRTLVAFVAGSGITPVLSMIRSVLQAEAGTSFYLFYVNKSQKEIIYNTELEELKIQYPKNLFIHHFFTHEKVSDKLFEGRINKQKVELIINQILDWDEVDKVLICGPNEMIYEIANAAYHHGIPKENILYEFYQPLNRKVYTDDAVSGAEKVEVTVISEGKKHQFLWENNGSSLLENLLARNIKAPYSCKNGFCGTCECKIDQGEVNLGKNVVLTEEDLQHKKILTCVAYPKSERIELIID